MPVTESDLSRIKPHPTAKLAAFTVGGAATLFAIIGGAIFYSGNREFDIDPFDFGLSPLLTLVSTPLIMFCGAYALTYAFCFALWRLFPESTRPGDDT
jgi:hypothetical protein